MLFLITKCGAISDQVPEEPCWVKPPTCFQNNTCPYGKSTCNTMYDDDLVYVWY